MAGETETPQQAGKELQWPITILAEQGTIEGVTLDVSEEGILIRCEEPLLLKETYRMSVLPPHHEAIGIIGKVVSSEFYGMSEDNATFGMGICQVQLPEEDLQLLSELALTIPES